jgi:hypothetical protein
MCCVWGREMEVAFNLDIDGSKVKENIGNDVKKSMTPQKELVLAIKCRMTSWLQIQHSYSTRYILYYILYHPTLSIKYLLQPNRYIIESRLNRTASARHVQPWNTIY